MARRGLVSVVFILSNEFFGPDRTGGSHLFKGDYFTVRVDDVQLPLRFSGHGKKNLPRTAKVSVVVALQSNNDDPDHQAAQRKLSFVAVVIVELGLYAPKDSSVGGVDYPSGFGNGPGVVPSLLMSWLLRSGLLRVCGWRSFGGVRVGRGGAFDA